MPTIIDLSTFHFFPYGKAPDEIEFAAAQLPLLHPVGHATTGLFGHHSKKAGLIDARAYANSLNQDMVVIDFEAHLDSQLPKNVIKRENMKESEFLNMDRISSSLSKELSIFWKGLLEEEGKTGSEIDSINWSLPIYFVSLRPDLVWNLHQHEHWSHFKIIVHPAVISTNPARTLMVASVFDQSIIQNKRTRLHPDIKVT